MTEATANPFGDELGRLHVVGPEIEHTEDDRFARQLLEHRAIEL
jgi:hypothetical protein